MYVIIIIRNRQRLRTGTVADRTQATALFDAVCSKVAPGDRVELWCEGRRINAYERIGATV